MREDRPIRRRRRDGLGVASGRDSLCARGGSLNRHAGCPICTQPRPLGNHQRLGEGQHRRSWSRSSIAGSWTGRSRRGATSGSWRAESCRRARRPGCGDAAAGLRGRSSDRRRARASIVRELFERPATGHPRLVGGARPRRRLRARQTLANAIAGILLAITQPIRIGDLVTFEEETGEVEDMKLTYTYIRLGDGRRLIVPNERLAQTSMVNYTIVERRVEVEVSVGLPVDDIDSAHGADAVEDSGHLGDVAAVEKDGVRAQLLVRGLSSRGSRAARPSSPRRLRLLREHGLSSAGGLLSALQGPRTPDDASGSERKETQARRWAGHAFLAWGGLAISAIAGAAPRSPATSSRSPPGARPGPAQAGQQGPELRRSSRPTGRGSATCSPTWSGPDPVERHPAGHAQLDGRDRGPALLPAPRRRLPGRSSARASRTSLPQDPAGRLDDDPAAGQDAVPRRTRDRDLKHKIIQAKMASSSRTSTRRRWILPDYLNNVPYGHRRRRGRGRHEAAAMISSPSTPRT